MARTIKRIAHDLIPLSDVITELSSIISQLLIDIKPHAQFKDVQILGYLEECAKASQQLAISAKLVREYIKEVNEEADKEGITKD